MEKMLNSGLRGLPAALAAAAVAVGTGLPAGAAPRPAAEKPNIVLFYVDDSGYGDYAHNGNPTVSTPRLTRLARDGVTCSQFYSSTPACSASRYSLMTGRFPARSGLNQWVIGPGTPRHLHAREVTIADGLRGRGYATGIFGKWHLGSPNKGNGFSPAAFPLAHGFDVWYGTNVSHDYLDGWLLESDPAGKDPIPGYRILAKHLHTNTPVLETLTQRCTAAALKFIEANKDRPFFAYIPFNMPHLGIHASPAFRGKSRRGKFGDVMNEIDDSVGRIRAKIEELGLTKNTVVIYSADNGPWIRFAKGISPKYGDARLDMGYAMPFRDGKGSCWEGGFRVPFLVAWPGMIPAGVVQQEPSGTVDMLPTLLALAGAEAPKDRTVDGRDIRALWMPEKGFPAPAPYEQLYCGNNTWPAAIRIGPWKLHIRLYSQVAPDNYGFQASRKKPLLFNVEQDISERIDRAAEKPEIVQRLLKRLEEREAQIRQEGTFWKKPGAEPGRARQK